MTTSRFYTHRYNLRNEQDDVELEIGWCHDSNRNPTVLDCCTNQTLNHNNTSHETWHHYARDYSWFVTRYLAEMLQFILFYLQHLVAAFEGFSEISSTGNLICTTCTSTFYGTGKWCPTWAHTKALRTRILGAYVLQVLYMSSFSRWVMHCTGPSRVSHVLLCVAWVLFEH